MVNLSIQLLGPHFVTAFHNHHTSAQTTSSFHSIWVSIVQVSMTSRLLLTLAMPPHSQYNAAMRRHHTSPTMRSQGDSWLVRVRTVCWHVGVREACCPMVLYLLLHKNTVQTHLVNDRYVVPSLYCMRVCRLMSSHTTVLCALGPDNLCKPWSVYVHCIYHSSLGTTARATVRGTGNKAGQRGRVK